MRMCAQEESSGTLKAVSLKILMVGSARGQQVRAELARAGHSVVSAPNLIEALEALLLQSFAAVLLADDVPPAEMEEVAAAVHEFDRRAGGQDRIPVLLIEPQGRGPEHIQSALQS